MIERHLPDITQVRIANKLSEAEALIRQYEPDILFQDIVMPEKNGFDFLSSLPALNFEIIFTTAYNEYAIRAIRFSALDYLLKPINADELKAAFERFLEKRKSKHQSEVLVRNLLQNLAQKQQTDFKLAIPTQTGAIFLSPAEIIRLEGEGNYTRFYMSNLQKHISSKTIKEYEEILSEHHFIRIHKSHFINKDYVESYLNEGSVILKDKTTLPVSRQRKQEVAAILKNRN